MFTYFDLEIVYALIKQRGTGESYLGQGCDKAMIFKGFSNLVHLESVVKLYLYVC